MMKKIKFLLFGLMLSFASFLVNAEPPKVYGPYDIDIIEVLDGDTIKADIHIFPLQTARYSIRLAGFDTPESGWRAKCDKERELGKKATEFTKRWIASHEDIKVFEVSFFKYAKRIGGEPMSGGSILSVDLADAGLAKPYAGGKKPNWCN